MKEHSLLVEIHTEELPPKNLFALSETFKENVFESLKKAHLTFETIKAYATPRRLALCITKLKEKQEDRIIERRGPALKAAYDTEGKPTAACRGFAESCGVSVHALSSIKTAQGEWVIVKQSVHGKTIQELMPALIEEALLRLPVKKWMRWGENNTQFIRPIHSVILLYGNEIISGKILNCETGRITRGHRFHHPENVTLNHADDYCNVLLQAKVMADFFTRKSFIKTEAVKLAKKCQKDADVLISSEEFLNEVTGLVEWPAPLNGQFDAAFLTLPKEVLISAMQDHQRYFPVVDKNLTLLPYFITIANLESHLPQQVIVGNERVLRARLADAQFFYALDQKQNLTERLEKLKTSIYQAKLGTLFEKTERLSKLAAFIANQLNQSAETAQRIGLMAKTDLTTHMVSEFPELQGIMGGYYANLSGENKIIATAISEQYLPKFAGDKLPESLLGQIIALTDRIDILAGAFGTGQIPTGDKDPYALRRAAHGILRILIDKAIMLDLKEVIVFALFIYGNKITHQQALPQLLTFIEERLRSYYQEQQINADIFASVAALNIANPYDFHQRILAVKDFKNNKNAESLSMANKRVSNILSKNTEEFTKETIDAQLFEHTAEKNLSDALIETQQKVRHLTKTHQYTEILLLLANLRQPIDHFFDDVMVMTDDPNIRKNRLLLLKQLRDLFLEVADVALLQ